MSKDVDFDYISNVLAGKHLRSCPQRRSSKSWVSNYQWKRRMQEKRWSQKQDGGEVFSVCLEKK